MLLSAWGRIFQRNRFRIFLQMPLYTATTFGWLLACLAGEVGYVVQVCDARDDPSYSYCWSPPKKYCKSNE